MELAEKFLDFFLHLDKHLLTIVTDYKNWTYLILFLIIFCETGFVITPFLPGDSLLFTAGAIAALGVLNIWLLVVLLCVAAILGDSVNYGIGKFLGSKVFEKNFRFINQKHLLKARSFYEKYGGKTIIIARFVPIVRTFAPFVAGVTRMNYSSFILYNIVGGIVWVLTCSFAGYFFGNIPVVKENFSIVIISIIIVSIVPIIIEFIRNRYSKNKQ
ncbi:MAG: DedA family protein [Bacteroidetes bacterium]|nr:DedA family protein [Bacteroidota bacterium]